MGDFLNPAPEAGVIYTICSLASFCLTVFARWKHIAFDRLHQVIHYIFLSMYATFSILTFVDFIWFQTTRPSPDISHVFKFSNVSHAYWALNLAVSITCPILEIINLAILVLFYDKSEAMKKDMLQVGTTPQNIHLVGLSFCFGLLFMSTFMVIVLPFFPIYFIYSYLILAALYYWYSRSNIFDQSSIGKYIFYSLISLCVIVSTMSFIFWGLWIREVSIGEYESYIALILVAIILLPIFNFILLGVLVGLKLSSNSKASYSSLTLDEETDFA